MKKVLSILAVVLMTIGMVSCDKSSASNDDVYEVNTSANDQDNNSDSGGSGGN